MTTTAETEFVNRRKDLAKALGYNTCPETTFIGTWEQLIEIVKKNHTTVCALRQLADES